MTEPLRILVLAANPVETNKLALDVEHRLLRNTMRDNAAAGNCELLVEWAARLKDLKNLLATHEPHVIHFAGHGTRNGICLEDDKGNDSPITKEELADLLQSLGRRLRLVVLNACFSAVQAEAIRQAVDYVVGTTAAVADDVAIRFAAHFYEELATGKTVREAHLKSQAALTSDHPTPIDQYELLVRSGTDDSKPLLPPMLPPTNRNTYDMDLKQARLQNAEFVNVSHDGPHEGTSIDAREPNEENKFAIRIDSLEVPHGTTKFINKRIRR